MGKGQSRKTAGKRKWKRHSHLNKMMDIGMEEIKETIRREGMDNTPKSKMPTDVTKMFVIDSGDNSKKALDPNRFKPKPAGLISKNAEKQINKIIKNGLPDNSHLEKEGVFDIWGSEVKPLTVKPVIPDTKKTYHIPAIIKPHSGQSINPSIKAQHELMQKIVD